jgi:hypothetical protein
MPESISPSFGPQPLLESIAVALETMGFIMPYPAEGPSPCPEEPRCVAIDYKCNQQQGAVEVMVPLALGKLLASNMLGLEPGEDPPRQDAHDALCELLNVTCGNLLRKITLPNQHEPWMGLPGVKETPTSLQWDEFYKDPNAILLDADGIQIAILMKAA